MDSEVRVFELVCWLMVSVGAAAGADWYCWRRRGRRVGGPVGSVCEAPASKTPVSAESRI